MTIDQLQYPVRLNFITFQKEYNKLTRSHIPLLNEVEDYLALTPGKQLRPLLVLLSAKASGTLSNGHILLATAVELLHNASLMHDDVVDESDTRRGNTSVRGHWGNQVAVLCGDYYLAQTMKLLQEVHSAKASALMADTVGAMVRGELLQLSVTRDRHATLQEYLSVIESKTATLISTCCQLGALNLADDSSPYRKPLADFGHHYGIVFQLLDDLGSLNPNHDATLPAGINPQSLIAEHTTLASRALNDLPPSPARDALASLLLPSAPKPC